MCGINGVFRAGDNFAAVRRMTDALAHRGPDDAGLQSLVDARDQPLGAFGHRRLAILDLTSAGHQPMLSEDGRYCITYNGEIYNFPELKHELEKAGVAFRSHCDTEAIIHGWALYGIPFLKKLRGMFAFALWDRDLRRGYLVRDAFGIKPLYVAATPGAVLFASEVRALVASGAVDRVLSAEGIASFLNSGSVAEPFTIVEGVRAIGPGTVVEVVFKGDVPVLGDVEIFAEAFPDEPAIALTMEESATLLRDALRDSVRHHLLSDVPVATFLSGGLDSSAIVGIATEVATSPLETFTVTFSEAEYNEGALALKVAERFHTKHHDVHVSESDLLNAMPAAFAAMDQPSLDGLNTYIVSGAVRGSGIKVALSGLGGDELFAGYPSFRRAARISPLWHLPSFVRGLSAFSARGLGGVRAEKINALMRSESPASGAYRASRMLFGNVQTSELIDGPQEQKGWSWQASARARSGMSLLKQVSVEELTGYMRNTLLRDSDVFSMAHGLEVRVPFLDPAVVRVAAGAADSSKLRGSASKPLLVKAVEDLLPPELLTCPKRGFTLPFEKWMRNDLGAELEAMFGGQAAEGAGLRRNASMKVWRSFTDNGGSVTWSRPWALYTLMRWAQEHDFAPPHGKPTAPGTPSHELMPQ